MVTTPYLPYILKDVVAKVDTFFSTRLTDPFNVFFDYGLYVDVSKNIYKKTNEGFDKEGLYPLIWLPMNRVSVQDATNILSPTAFFDLIIAMPTDKDYSQLERDELTFLPRLIPIWDQLRPIMSIAKDNRPKIAYRPYWGGSEGGSDTKNLFGDYIDALHITGIEMPIKKQNCIPTFKLK